MFAVDQFPFYTFNSHRVRAGGRLNYTNAPDYTPYVGLYYEYEFDGKPKGRTLGFEMDEASLKVGTGILELGVNFLPTENKRLTVQAGVIGYAGQRDGIAGTFRMEYAFE